MTTLKRAKIRTTGRNRNKLLNQMFLVFLYDHGKIIVVSFFHDFGNK